MYKILLILTGGTIGSVNSDGIIDVRSEVIKEGSNAAGISGCMLTDNYYGNCSTDDVVFEIRRPLNILSENMNPEYWNIIADTVTTESKGCDGIIIAHGSDTLSYTSAAMAWIFRGINIPVMLTAANHPLDDPDTNGNANFAACVDYICGRAKGGVFTVYRDNSGRINVYNAATICEADGYLDGYHDQTGEVYGYVEDSRFIINKSYTAPQYYIGQEYDSIGHMTDNVLCIRPYPGIRYGNVNIHNNKPACVLHWLYHAGTAAAGSYHKDNNLTQFIEECRSEHVPIYIGPVKHSGDAVYASHKKLIDSGAIPLYDMNFESAYSYLVIKYSIR